MRIPNTFGFDVKAAVYAEYHSVEELEKWIAEGRITSPFAYRMRQQSVVCERL